MVEYKWLGGDWRPVYSLDSMEYDVPMPEEIRKASVPEHHDEVVDEWWGARLSRTLAVGETEDWRFILHAIDVNEKGDIYLTLSREPKAGSIFASPEWTDRMQGLSVRAQDELGQDYVLPETTRRGQPLYRDEELAGSVLGGLPETHVRVKLARAQSQASSDYAKTLTISVISGASVDKAKQWETVQLAPVPIPKAQPGDDLIAAAIRSTKR